MYGRSERESDERGKKGERSRRIMEGQSR